MDKNKILQSDQAKKAAFIFQLLLGIFIALVGVSILFRENFWWSLILASINIGLAGTVILFTYRAIANRSRIDLLIAGGALMFLLVILINPNFHKEFFALNFGIWALFNAAVRGLELYIAYRDKQRGKIIITIQVILELVMGVLLITAGLNNFFLVNIQVGLYVVLYGITQIIALFRVSNNGYVVRMPMPVIATAFLPSFLVTKIQKEVQQNPEIVKDTVEATSGNHVSIYIYAKNHGYNRMGHIDIGYNGAIYSYGCHDQYNRAKSQAFGDGVLIVGSETEYVQYCVDDDTTVFRFLCELTDQQREYIEARIEQLLEPAYFYHYPMDREGAHDYFLGFLKDAGITVDFYKFIRGSFKTYNVFTTNCVLVADYIVRSTGMQLLHIDGIITPGSYYQYLHQNVNKPGSIVVREDVYKKIGAVPKHDK